jgi:acyl dehydratase
MNENHTPRRGFFFEEFQVGMKLSTPARTVTEADVVNFAGVSGDFTSIHTDAEYMKTTPFGQRIAHGLFVLSALTGLAARSGFLEGTVLAFREINQWKFSRPVFIGDTIHGEFEVEETKPLPRLGGGAVILIVRVINQEDQIVMKGRFNLLVQSQP